MLLHFNNQSIEIYILKELDAINCFQIAI
jgi:hypothetical protein